MSLTRMSFAHALGVCMTLGIAGSSLGQTVVDFVSVSKHAASDFALNDGFGKSVSISGDVALIGCSGNDDFGTRSGSAYVFERDADGNWSEAEKLLASDGDENESFGYSVSISGETAVVGAYGDGDNGLFSGSAYVFERDAGGNWLETQKLTASDGEEADYFGISVAISGNYIVVGASMDDGDEIDSGSAYVFERDADDKWLEAQKLTASDDQGDAWFAERVSISGNHVLIGSPFSDGNSAFSGGAYVFERDDDGNWSEAQKLVASNGSSLDYFGLGVSISSDRAVVGATDESSNAELAGRAYVFERDGDGNWPEVAQLAPSDFEEDQIFGYTVSISGDWAVIGAPGEGIANQEPGSAYLFECDADGNWSEIRKLVPASGTADENDFGFAVSISGDSVLIADPMDADGGENSGSVYTYDFDSNVINLDASDAMYIDVADAVHEAMPGDRLAVRSDAFQGGFVNFAGKPINFIAVESCSIPAGLTMNIADGTTFSISPDVDPLGVSLVSGGDLLFPSDGETVLDLDFHGSDSGVLFQNGATLMCSDTFASWGASTSYLSGTILADLVWTNNVAQNVVYDETMVLGDYFNEATTIVHRGTLHITGDLTNTGIMLGEVDTGPGFVGGEAPEPGDGFSIGGSYTVGANATMAMADPAWWLRVGGDLDIAINNPANFTMSEATIELTGLAPGKAQAFETLSVDLGPEEAGFDSSNLPIGALRIAGNSTVQLVNNHANSTGAACEVVYVDELLVEAGGYLATGGCTIYARSTTIHGEVDDPDSIVIVEDTPPCLGDLTGDGEVNGADLGLMIAMWGTPDGDLTGDGMTNGADLGLLIAGWGLCN
ncbi:MAG: hypothetical protein MK085_04325 [Phycisphaerales bacterium]|nr:hypothetical protein [Phycisphaerales bacterium]